MERIVKDNQTLVDVAMLTYGQSEAYFKLVSENEDLLLEDGEIDLSKAISAGTTINFDQEDILYRPEIANAIAREPIEAATKQESYIGQIEALPPTELKLSAVTLSQIQLEWDDLYTTETGYQLQELVNGQWQDVATVPENTTNHTIQI